MVTDAVIRFLGQSVRAILGLVPSWQPPADDFGSTATNLGAIAAQGNGYFPVMVLGVCLALVLALKVFLLGWRLVLFIYHQVWGSD